MQKVFRGALALMLAALVLGVTSCGQVGIQSTSGNGGGNTNTNGPIKIAVVPKAIGFSFWESVHQGALCAASKQKQVTVQWNGVTAETDVTGQVNLLQNFITQGVNGLVYAATDAKVLKQVTDQALKNNISVVNIDSGTKPQPSNVPVFATDNVASAQKAADLLSTALNGKGKIAFIPFQPGTSTNDERSQGFKQGLANHPGLQLVAEQSSQSDVNTALAVTSDILTAHPDLNGIFAANEPGVLGAAEAVRRAGKAGKIVIIGWDASSDEIKGVQQGVITALVVQNPFRMGFDGVNAAVKMIRQHAQVQNEDTGVTFVTKGNLNDPKVQVVLNPSCANPPT
jgi:ribose transport system substrate-binding protein